MKAILFDVDDTLYDQQLLFENAFRDVFGDPGEISMEDLFKTNQKYSNQSFHAVENGEMTKEEMYIYRIQRAVADFGIQASDEQSMEFQERYTFHGQHIFLSEQMKEILDYCSAHMKLGVITNGPSAHQWRKTRVLNLKNWVDEAHIFVSGDVGIRKPERGIFDYVRTQMQLDESETVYVGDSYVNDIIGATQAGWHAVWMNRRNVAVPEDFPQRAQVVRSEEELYRLIKGMA